jgi:threonine dehydratase
MNGMYMQGLPNGVRVEQSAVFSLEYHLRHCLQDKARREGMVFIPPYDDPYIIAGQGTTGAEILRQLTSQQKDNLEAIFVPIGGGGLAAGVACYVKQLLPHVKVFGVEPSGELSGLGQPILQI